MNVNKLELAQEEKRVRSVMKSEAGRQALRNILGYNFVFPGDKDFDLPDAKPVAKKLPRVAVLMPSHSSPMPETTTAYAHMHRATDGHAILLSQPSVSSSVVSWVRNDLLSRLLKSGTEWDYVLFMDDDIVPPADAIAKLLAHNVGIVAGACTVRQDPPLPNFRSYDDKTFCYRTAFEWQGNGLIEVGAVGTGFMLIRRAELEQIASYYVQCQHETKFLGMPAEKAAELSELRKAKAVETENYWWFEFLKHPLGDGEYGEDISFCFKARQLGIPIYVDTSVRCGHVGRYAYGLHDFEVYREQILADQKLRTEPMTISLLVPTRGRPENIKRLLQSIKDTATVFPQVILRCDSDDPTCHALQKMLTELTTPWLEAGDWQYPVTMYCGDRICLSECWNEAAKRATGDILMHAGDDITFNTKGWDQMVVRAFQQVPDRIVFVHGDDGAPEGRGKHFGTHGFIHRNWVNTVGYFVPPYFSSDYNDTWLNEVANALGRRLYVPFVTEHFHPLFGKAEWDTTHKERLERHKKDDVASLYAELAPKRAEDVEKLKQFMNSEYIAARSA